MQKLDPKPSRLLLEEQSTAKQSTADNAIHPTVSSASVHQSQGLTIA